MLILYSCVCESQLIEGPEMENVDFDLVLVVFLN